MILVMPLHAFSKLNLHPKKRCKEGPNYPAYGKVLIEWAGALLGVFMVGGIAVIASIIRLYALYVYTTTKDVAYDAIYVRRMRNAAAETMKKQRS